MFLNRRLVLVLLQLFFTIFSESKTPSKKDRHLFALLGYLQGYKIGYDYSLQLPPIVPVIVLPTINQHQSVSILKTYYDNKFPENKDNDQTTLPLKLVSNNSSDTSNEYEVEVVEQSIIRDSLELKRHKPINGEPKDTLRQADNIENINATTDKNTKIETSTLQAQDVTEVPIQSNVTEVSKNTTAYNTTENPVYGYPTALYDNEFVTSIQLTTESDEATGLPLEDDKKWQNFTSNENGTQVNENQPNVPTEQGGPYSAALYDNAFINNLVLTSKLYEKDTYLPPVQDERWKNFSSETLYENSGQFKPLAGLYYDGFLHRPLTKIDFVPRPNYMF